MRTLLVTWVALFSQIAFAVVGQDHVLYYQGVVRWTDLSGKVSVPADQAILLKKEIAPSRDEFVETATMVNYQGQMCDATTVVKIKGNTISARTSDGMIIGTGFIKEIGPNGDFSYLNITMVVVPTGTTVKDINYITPEKLIARKEISNSSGVPTTLWESDLSLISEVEYKNLYQKFGSSGSCK